MRIQTVKEFKGKSGLLAVLPSWFFISSVIILVGIIITMAIKDLNRARSIETQTLLEKSSVLIRAFESGTRTGMGMRWRNEQMQILIEEMAYQPGILYIAVTDDSGRILAHSDPELIGSQIYNDQTMKSLDVSQTEKWRMTKHMADNEQQNAF